MGPLIDALLRELREKHGEDLDFENHHYFLFYADGVFDVYFDKEEKTIKVDVTYSDGIKVYFSDKTLEAAMKNS